MLACFQKCAIITYIDRFVHQFYYMFNGIRFSYRAQQLQDVYPRFKEEAAKDL